jgi:hypothetical protein
MVWMILFAGAAIPVARRFGDLTRQMIQHIHLVNKPRGVLDTVTSQ